MNIGSKVKIREDLEEYSVAYCQRGKIGYITKFDSSRTFPYFVDFKDDSNERFNWFWTGHLEEVL